MSVFSALTVGTSSLQAQGTKIGIISDNIANVSTVGYKKTSASFEDLIYNDRSPTLYSPAGALSVSKSVNAKQGELTNGDNISNIAVSGIGFFVVSDLASGGSTLYSRTGSFAPDVDGNFVNGNGFFLKAWPLDTLGTLASTAAPLETVNVAKFANDFLPTTSVSIRANLDSTTPVNAKALTYDPTSATANMASGAVEPDYNRVITVVDSEGAPRDLNTVFLKTSNNTWAVEILGQPASDVAATNGQVAYGTIRFNGDGTLADVSPALQSITASWNSGSSVSIGFNWGTAGQMFGTPGATVIGRGDGLTQTASPFSITSITKDGNEIGKLKDITIDKEGYISINYDDATTRKVYKIPLAIFRNFDQLTSLSGNAFEESENSGNALLVEANKDGYGSILGGTLESSNVDLADQLTEIIIAQRAYQSNTKLISTADALLENLTNMI